MKYKLINKQTGEEHICQKVTIDGMDYYMSDEKVHFGYVWNSILEQIETMFKEKTFHDDLKGVIATNNPNIDIPKVVDEVEKLFPTNRKGTMWMPNRDEINNQYKQEGYNKSQETHPFSEEDMIEFLGFIEKTAKLSFESTGENTGKTYKELLQLWKEQKPKIVYYEN